MEHKTHHHHHHHHHRRHSEDECLIHESLLFNGKKPYQFAVPQVTEDEVKQVFEAEKCRQTEKFDLCSLDFNMWQFQEDYQLLPFVFSIFEQLGLIESFQISKTKLQYLLIAIEKGYRKNPFHNFMHAFTITQGLLVFLKSGCGEKFTEVDLLGLVLSSLCHDLDHPGLGNGYHISACTSLAVRYNDSSPLENHHSACAWQLLLHPSYDILSQLPPTQLKELRKMTTTIVMATDLASHFRIVKEFEEKIASGSFSWEKAEDRILVCCMMVKMADIANEARPWAVSEPWAQALFEEFFNQGDFERKSGMAVTPFMNRELVSKPKTQLGFIDTFLIPIFNLLTKLFPSLQTCLEGLNKNKLRWSQMLEACPTPPTSSTPPSTSTPNHQPNNTKTT